MSLLPQDPKRDHLRDVLDLRVAERNETLHALQNLQRQPRLVLEKEVAATNSKEGTLIDFRKLLFAVVGLAALLLAACNNQYRAPVSGLPLTWGQKHYQDNQRYQEAVEQGRAD